MTLVSCHYVLVGFYHILSRFIFLALRDNYFQSLEPWDYFGEDLHGVWVGTHGINIHNYPIKGFFVVPISACNGPTFEVKATPKSLKIARPNA